MTATIGRSESYYLTIMTMTMTARIGRTKFNLHAIMTMPATIRRSESYYFTIMTMTATIGRSESF